MKTMPTFGQRRQLWKKAPLRMKNCSNSFGSSRRFRSSRWVNTAACNMRTSLSGGFSPAACWSGEVAGGRFVGIKPRVGSTSDCMHSIHKTVRSKIRPAAHAVAIAFTRMKLVECVPNISEGRRPELYEAVAAAAASVNGVTLLNVDPGADTNRTVITFVGEPEAVLEGAFQLIHKGIELIDMSTHRGAHPRIGAVDVVPFIPVSGVTMDDCVDLARRLGERDRRSRPS